MVTATISNIVRQGITVIATVQFSDGFVKQYILGLEDTVDSMSTRVQSDLDIMNLIDNQLTTIQASVNSSIQSSNDVINSITSLQNKSV